MATIYSDTPTLAIPRLSFDKNIDVDQLKSIVDVLLYNGTSIWTPEAYLVFDLM